jgi:hypothetical protein
MSSGRTRKGMEKHSQTAAAKSDQSGGVDPQKEAAYRTGILLLHFARRISNPA